MADAVAELTLKILFDMLGQPVELLPDMDCKNCMWKALPQGGHCFIFNEPPDYHGKCAQFRKDPESARP